MEALKRCVTCQQMLPLTAFNKRKLSKDGLQFRCRECFRTWYEVHEKSHKRVVYARVKRLRAIRYEQLHRYLLDHPCTDCGNCDATILEFDHVGSDKFKDISTLVHEAYPWEVILDEIAKCNVVCANCHRRRTHLRANSIRVGWLQAGDAQ